MSQDKGTEGIERGLAVGTLLLTFAVFAFASSGSALFHSNQNVYFAQGLRQAGEAFLQRDWFAATTSPHLSFTLLVRYAAQAGVLAPVVSLTSEALRASLWAGLVLIAFALRRRHRAPSPATTLGALASLTVYALLVHRIGLPEALDPGPPGQGPLALEITRDLLRFSGMAGQSIHDDYLEPARFGALALLGLALLLRARWRWAAAVLGGAACFHASYLLHAGLAAGVAAAWLWRTNERREAIAVSAIFAAFALPIALYSLSFASSSGPEAKEALTILATQRVPHHALPSYWWDAGEWARLAVMLGGAWVVWQRDQGPFRLAVLAGLAMAILGVAWVAATGDLRVGLAFPWRSSTLLFPIAVIALLRASLGDLVERCLAKRSRARIAVLVAAVLTLGMVAGSFALDRPMPRRQFPEIDRFADLVRANTPEDAIVLIPARVAWQDFRMRARRAIYVDHKAHPFLPEELLEWRRRVLVARAFHSSPSGQRVTLCAWTGADFYAVRSEHVGPSETLVAATPTYSLMRCPPQGKP